MRCVSKLILAFVFAGSSVFATDSMSLLCESSLGNIFWNQEGGKIIKKDSEEREIVCGRGFNKPTQAVAHSSKDIVVFKTKSGSFWLSLIARILVTNSDAGTTVLFSICPHRFGKV